MKGFFKRAAALILCAALLCTTALAAERYTDVPAGAWYEEAVSYCRESGLMQGTGGGRFTPDKKVNRCTLAVVLYRLAGTPAVEAGNYTDVAPDAWYADGVYWAASAGLMSGEDGQFDPGGLVTREQLAEVFHRWAGSPSAPESDFTDRSAISEGARTAVDWAKSSGLMSGYGGGRFVPAGTLTRAQLAQVLANRGQLTATQISAIDVMCRPCGVAAMEDGSLLVSDLYNKVIWRVSGGKATVFAGSETVEDIYGQPIGGYHDADFLESTFKAPWAIAPFLNGWAVSDAENNVVRFLRTGEDREEDQTPVTDLGLSLDHPTGLTADGEGNLYVAETFQGRISKITPSGRKTTHVSGLSEPMGLCWADGSLYVAECGGNRVLRVTADGRYTVVAGSGENGSADGPAKEAQFSGPKGVAVAEDGTVYVADTDNGAVRRVRDGQVTTILSRDPWDTETLFPVSPTGLLLQGSTLYISDTFARKLLALPLV